MTRAAQEFITPLSVGALSNERVFTELFDLDDEREIGHIRLSREAALIVVAPATADLLAKMAGGHADDLATVRAAGHRQAGAGGPRHEPAHVAQSGDPPQRGAAARRTACISSGPRWARWPSAARPGPGGWPRCRSCWRRSRAARGFPSPLRGGARGGGSPTTFCNPPPPVPPRKGEGTTKGAGHCAGRSPAGTCWSPAGRRTSRSIRCATSPTAPPASRARHRRRGRALGARGDARSPARRRCRRRPASTTVRVETAREMLEAVRAALPADIAVFAAAVADWRVAAQSSGEDQEGRQGPAPRLELIENPDILKTIAAERAGRAAAAGHRLCRRDRERGRVRQEEAQGQGRRLDRRQRRLAARPASWAATATPCIW